MAPKGKKTKKDVIIDGVNTTPMSREQLERFSLRLKEALDKEREERNLMQVERDKIKTFWDISRKQLEECRAELRNKDRELEDEESRHQQEETLFRQKEKHLLYEHQTGVSEILKSNLNVLKRNEDEFEERRNAILSDKKNLKEKIIEQETEHTEVVKSLKVKFSEELSKARDDFQTEAREIENKYESKLQELRSELSLRHTMEMSEVDERKNKHIANLIKNHDKSFIDMKDYYNDITMNNMALIENLKKDIVRMKKREIKMERILKDLNNEKKTLEEPTMKAIAEAKMLRVKLSNYERGKTSMIDLQKNLAVAEKNVEVLQNKNDVLIMKFEGAEAEREKVKHDFAAAVSCVEQKSALKNVMLEEKLKAMINLFDQQEMHFAETLAALNVDAKELKVANARVDSIWSRKISYPGL